MSSITSHDTKRQHINVIFSYDDYYLLQMFYIDKNKLRISQYQRDRYLCQQKRRESENYQLRKETRNLVQEINAKTDPLTSVF